MLIKSPMKKEKVKENKRNNTRRKSKRSIRDSYGSNGKDYGKRIKSDKKKTLSLPKLKPWKVIVGALVLGALGILYLNHVFATQELLREVQQLEQEYNQAKRMHDDYRLTYDRMIGPAEIYENAKSAGFINGGPAEKVIEVED